MRWTATQIAAFDELDRQAALRRERETRIFKVEERLRDLGIAPDDLMDFLDEYRSRRHV